VALAMAVALGLAGAPAAPSAESDLAGTRALVTRLKAAGRAEAAITVTLADPMGGPDRVQRGRIALEPPDRVRLDFAGSGERIALRGDGGEWIQPESEQLVRLRRDQAGLAAWLWEVFLHGGTAGFRERALAGRRFALEPRERDTGLPDGITLALDAAGLPVEIEFAEPGGGATRYRFAGWRFARARGATAFTLAAPRGYAVVDLP
jgi:hypothetical protein